MEYIEIAKTTDSEIVHVKQASKPDLRATSKSLKSKDLKAPKTTPPHETCQTKRHIKFVKADSLSIDKELSLLKDPIDIVSFKKCHKIPLKVLSLDNIKAFSFFKCHNLAVEGDNLGNLENCRKLINLKFEWCQMNDEGVISLFNKLKFTALETLSLKNNNLTLYFFSYLNSHPVSKTLKTLDLSINNINLSDIKGILDSWAFQNLVNIDLSAQSIRLSTEEEEIYQKMKDQFQQNHPDINFDDKLSKTVFEEVIKRFEETLELAKSLQNSTANVQDATIFDLFEELAMKNKKKE